MQGLSYFKSLATSAASSLRDMAVTSMQTVRIQKEYFATAVIGGGAEGSGVSLTDQ